MRLRGVVECLKSINVGDIRKKSVFIIVLLLLFYMCTRKYGNTNKFANYNKFDHLIFSIRWLPTSCIEYIEKNPSSDHPHFCTLPKNYKTWRIHGLWPTQDKSLGPFFCNRSMTFDISKIRSIETDLEFYWPNIEGGKSVASLWQHEWEKHGTCAAQLQSLDSEIKYFNMSLSLYKILNIEDILTKNNIIPSKKSINILELLHLLKRTLGKMPQIHCIHEVKTKQPYLSEIRLCYNNNLELIDCKDMHNNEFNNDWDLINALSDCPQDRNALFPDTINPALGNNVENKNSQKLNYFNKFYENLFIIRVLQWVSI